MAVSRTTSWSIEARKLEASMYLGSSAELGGNGGGSIDADALADSVPLPLPSTPVAVDERRGIPRGMAAALLLRGCRDGGGQPAFERCRVSISC